MKKQFKTLPTPPQKRGLGLVSCKCHSEDFSPKNPAKYNNLSNYDSQDLLNRNQRLDSSLLSVVQNYKSCHHETLNEQKELKKFSSSVSNLCDFEMLKQVQHDKKRKCAFTLAETLITLVIVGVVAALTVPVLMNKMQDRALQSKFKKVYSYLSKAINQADFEFGYNTNCYYVNNSHNNGNCTAFFKSFSSKLNVIKSCQKNLDTTGCLPEKYVEELSKSIYQYSTFANMYIANGWLFILSDGTIILENYGGYIPEFFIDINGVKGPNLPGYDLYCLKLIRNKEILEIDPNSLLYRIVYYDLPQKSKFKTLKDVYSE